MIKELWINLPVKDVKRTRDFFLQVGFSINKNYGDGPDSVCFMVGSKNMVVMFFSETTLKGYVQNKLTDTTQSNEVLFSFDAESRAEVDEMAKKVESAGGTIYSKPQENQGWMYGFAFCDPDGHRWNMLYMDMSKLPKK